MNAKQILIAVVIAIALAITSIGCYTIIRHPSMDTMTEVSPEATTQAGYNHSPGDYDCVSCHRDYAEYPYGFYYNPLPEYYWEYPRWGDYYAYPWWWDDYWYNSSGSPSSVVIDTVDKIARPERQRGLPPPYVTGAEPLIPSLPTFNSGSNPPPVITNPNTGTTTGGNTGTTPPTNTGKDDKKEDTKPPKRRGK